MPYELFISLRYLKAKRKQAFISVISVISIGGVTVGVAALILVLAVMTGFKDDIRDKILGTTAHIVIQQTGATLSAYDDDIARLQALPHIATIAPYVSAQVLLNSSDNVSGIQVTGIDPHRRKAVAHIERKLVEGHVDLLSVKFANQENSDGPRRSGIILGMEPARLLHVFTGDEVTMILPMGNFLPTGFAPKLKKFRVVGIVNSGFYEYDAGRAYISLTDAQRFFSMETDVSGLEVRLDNVYRTKEVARALRQELGNRYDVQDWTERHQSLFSAINLEKLAMFLILALIVLVAAFNIISTLVMMVIEKQTDIAILKSMGATSGSIMRIFMLEGSVIGIIGTILGVGSGILLSVLADRYKWFSLPGGSYYLDHLPFTVTAVDVVLVAISSMVICFLSTVYPARQASRLDPVVVFRYE